MVTPVAGREAAAHLRDGFAMSEPRASRVVAVDRSSVRFQRRRRDDDRLRERLKGLAEKRRRIGYPTPPYVRIAYTAVRRMLCIAGRLQRRQSERGEGSVRRHSPARDTFVTH
jgi:hypothetical protein